MAEDLETLKKALVCIVPQDQHGRGVLYMHRTRMHPAVASRSSIVSQPLLSFAPSVLL
jgi:hypothetical protein